MASGGILLDGDNKRILDALGKQTLDDSCVRCCCTSTPGQRFQRYKVVVAGVVIHTCPVPNFLNCIGNPALCDYDFNLFSCGGGNPTADNMCGLNIAGNINGTYYLSGEGSVPGFGSQCAYDFNPSPPPITISLNRTDLITSRFICNSPIQNLPNITTAIIVTFANDGSGQRLGFSIASRVANVPNVPTTSVLISLFNNLDRVPGCGFLCTQYGVMANQNVLSWISGGEPLIYAGIGGTATLTEI